MSLLAQAEESEAVNYPHTKSGILCRTCGWQSHQAEVLFYELCCVVLNVHIENCILCWAHDCHNSLSHNKISSQKGKWNHYFLYV